MAGGRWAGGVARAVAIALVMMLAGAAAAQWHPEFPWPEEHPHRLELYERWREEQGLAIRRATGLAIPERLPNNPEYLVRVLYLVPTDRAPADQGAFDAKAADAAGRIRLILESMSAYYRWEMVNTEASDSGERVNFERDANGEIRVMPLRGRMPVKGTAGYWGDTVGLNWVEVYYRVLDDIFGDSTMRKAATEKTVYIIFGDVMDVVLVDGFIELRGYVGAGSSENSSSGGWGGVAQVSAGILDLWPSMLYGSSLATQKNLLRDALCNTATNVTLQGVTAPMRAGSPRDNVTRTLMQAELASIYMGVVAHELVHAFGLIHDLATPDPLMHASYPRFGEALRTMYGLAPCATPVPLTGAAGGYSKLGFPFATVLAHCPYFVNEVHPDKTDPRMAFAWPPVGHVYAVAQQTGASYPFAISADDGDGSGANIALLYNGGDMMAHGSFDGADSVGMTFTPFWWDRFVGQRLFQASVFDNGGNLAGAQHRVFGLIYENALMGQVVNNTLFVRRPAGEDTRPRNAGAPKGSFHNPYDTVAQAVAAAPEFAGYTIVVGRGVHPIAVPIRLFPGVAITGEAVGESILDGQGLAVDLILDDAFAYRLQDVTISNLVFRNAHSGIRKTSTHDHTWHVTISNNIFHDLTGVAIDYRLMRGWAKIEQNTVDACGAGIRIVDYSPFTAAEDIVLRNNTVTNCAGTGIDLSNVANLRTRGRSGWNNAHGNGANFAGNGAGGGDSYASVRLPGEISSPPEFRGPSRALLPHSALVKAGDPWTQNANGTRRDIGAVINTPGAVGPVHGWGVR